jgi:DNA-binding TFAR19-related protein (PDSD5 family)
MLEEAEERLRQIRLERESVAGYFESLRGVLSQAEKVSSQD